MHNAFLTALLVLSMAVPTVALFRWLRIPSILAYLFIGVIASPHQLGFMQPSDHLYKLADFGVVFLMFTIGLEFSLAKLISMRKLVFGLGGTQVVLTMALVMLAGLWLGQSWQGGVVLGGAIAMSSTAIIARVLSERLEVHSAHGRQVMGVLLFQDLAVVPLLILTPMLATAHGVTWVDLVVVLLNAVIVLLAIMLLGKRLIQPLFSVIVRRHSTELFVLNVLWVVLGMAALTQLAGLSLALGAFLGGMLISETLYRHQVESDIRPFRDILLGLFFITIGMELNLPEIVRDAAMVLTVLLGLLVVKFSVVALLSLAMRSNPVTAMRAAVQLSFAGEFGFVLLSQASDFKLLDEATTQVVLAAMLLSMMLGPVLAHKSRQLVALLLGKSAWASRGAVEEVAAQANAMTGHVVVCGYGRTGQSVVDILQHEGIPNLTLELDGALVSLAENQGRRVAFGDASKKEVLIAAGVQRALVIVVTHNDVGATIRTLTRVRMLNPDVPIIVRMADDQSRDRIKSAGATEVVSEVQECSLMLAMRTLMLAGSPQAWVEKAIQRARDARYNSL